MSALHCSFAVWFRALKGRNPSVETRRASFIRSERRVAPGATIKLVGNPADEAVRTFKTAWFAKAARKAHLTDEALCSAIQQVILGQADDLGGG
jgi:RelE toxin of RelE / RelB toxin-antitoxin system